MATNNVLYVNDGNYGPPDHARAGRLAPMVQGQYGQDVKLEIRNMVGSVMSLTGFSTITGYKQKGDSVTVIVGTLTLSGTPTVAPQITWVVAAADTGDYGTFDVVFRIGNGTDLHKTHPVKLEIRPDPEAAGLPAAPAVVGVTAAEKAILADFLAAAVAATAGQVYVFDGAASGGEGAAGGGAVDVASITTTGGTNAQMLNVKPGGGLQYRSVAQTLADLRDSGALATPDISVIVQGYSAKTAAIAALTWAANSIILLTGSATASVQALAAHVVTFLQSATATDARTAIGAAALGANTFTGEQTFADQLLTRPVIKDYGEAVNAIGSTGGGTQDIDLTLGNVVSATVDTSANTFTFSNPSASGTACSFTLFLTNGGSQTVNWPASVDWAGATAPTLTAAGVDILTFVTLNAGTTWYGFAAGLEMS